MIWKKKERFKSIVEPNGKYKHTTFSFMVGWECFISRFSRMLVFPLKILVYALAYFHCLQLAGIVQDFAMQIIDFW